MKSYLVAYDILCAKRAVKIRKFLYGYSFGGQKSVLEMPLDGKDLKGLLTILKPLLSDEDRVNIIEIKSDTMLFGKADILNYDRGVVIV